MDNLSPETVRQILHHIPDKSDLESFRLVQRSFADLGKDFLFDTIDVWPTRESLERLHGLSARSDLAWHVRRLILNFVYDTKTLIWNRVKGRLHPTDTHRGPFWDRYASNTWVFKGIATEYYDFLTSRDHTSILMASLIHLKRLEAIHTRDGDGSEGCLMTTAEEKAHFGAWGLRDYDGAPGSWADPNSYFAIEALRALVDAARYTDIKIRSFQSINEIPQLIFEEPTLLKGFASFLRNCNELQLRFDTENNEGVIPFLQQNPLAIVFASTKLLVRLNLHFSVRPDITVGFEKLLGDEQISEFLKEVNFVGIDMHSNDLHKFFSLHNDTLRYLTIHHSKLFTGFWIDMAEWMKDNLSLDCVGFLGLTNPDEDATRQETTEEAAVSLQKMKMLELYVLGGKRPSTSWLP